MDLNEDKFLAQLLETFRSEAQEHLTAIASGLLTLEQGSLSCEEHNRVIEQIFRDTHSLKGAARAVGLREIETLCQQQESVFSAVKKGILTINPDSFDLFHAVIHAVEQLLSQDTGVKTADLIRQLKAVVAGETVSIPIQNHVAPLQRETQSSITGPVQDEISEPVNPDHILDTKPGDSNNTAPPGFQEPERILHNAKYEKNQVKSEPELVKGDGSGSIKTNPMIKISSERLEDLFSRADDLIGARLASSQRSSSIRDLLQNFLSWRWAWTQITTDIEHLRTETFQSRNGSQISHLSEIERIAGFLEYNHTFIHSLEHELTAISRAVVRDQYLLDTATTELIDEIKQVILVPASSLLEIYPLAARDLAKEKGKSVDVLLSGAEIEIDRRILEEIRDPILHIIRNSIDHGIESPEIRLKQGKPERGTIQIRVTHTRGHLIEIMISDDGGGIDYTSVRSSAISKGIIPTDEAQGLTEEQIRRLIFKSGLSTTPVVSTISGRGLGLAIVLEKVERIGGTVQVETSSLGTTFTLILPLTLATFRGIRVLAGNHPYFLPLRSIERVMVIQPDFLKTIENRTIVEVDNESVGVIRLSHILGLPESGVSSGKKSHLLITSASGIRFGLLVDEVIGVQEIVVKDLGRQLRRVKHISGASITGDGGVVPVINCEDLAASITGMKHIPQPELIPDQQTGQRRILVTEDSITSRMLLKNILEGAGYLVETAVDGVDALIKLKQNMVDLVVSDVDMPRMNGFVLTEKIRSDPAFTDLPVILVTSLDSREDREHGITVGANAYMVKSSFDQSNLLEMISRHIQ